jgi:hypothetical protein
VKFVLQNGLCRRKEFGANARKLAVDEFELNVIANMMVLLELFFKVVEKILNWLYYYCYYYLTQVENYIDAIECREEYEGTYFCCMVGCMNVILNRCSSI